MLIIYIFLFFCAEFTTLTTLFNSTEGCVKCLSSLSGKFIFICYTLHWHLKLVPKSMKINQFFLLHVSVMRLFWTLVSVEKTGWGCKTWLAIDLRLRCEIREKVLQSPKKKSVDTASREVQMPNGSLDAKGTHWAFFLFANISSFHITDAAKLQSRYGIHVILNHVILNILAADSHLCFIMIWYE